MVEQARELVRKSGKAMVVEGACEGAEVQMSEVSGQRSAGEKKLMVDS
jgi:hypothetical protein